MLTKRKLVSIAISICMILTLIPANAFATETEGTAPVLKISKEGKGITLSWDVAENANRYIVLKKNSNGEFEKYKELEVEEKQTAQKESPSEAEIKDETQSLDEGGTKEDVELSEEAIQEEETSTESPKPDPSESVVSNRPSEMTYTDENGKLNSTYALYFEDSNGNISETSDEKTFMENPQIPSVSITSKGFNIKWNRVENAQGYYLYQRVKSGDFKKIKTLDKDTLSFNVTNGIHGYPYKYKVGAYYDNEELQSPDTKVYYFLKTTYLTSITSGNNGTFYTKIKTLKGISGYHVQFAKNASYENASNVYTTKLSAKKGGFSKYGKTYARVRTYKTINGTKYYSAWSGSKKCNHIGGVPYLNQMKSYPTGCESVSTVMAMKYLGADISYGHFMDKCLPKGSRPHSIGKNKFRSSNPWSVFMGNPRSRGGWGCYAPVIKKAVDRADTSVGATVLKKKSLSSICSTYIDNNYPVAIWATTKMKKPGSRKTLYTPSGKRYWKSPLHCVLLIGYDSSYYYFNDPISGKNKIYKRSTVESRYKSIGSQAVAFYKK